MLEGNGSSAQIQRYPWLPGVQRVWELKSPHPMSSSKVPWPGDSQKTKLPELRGGRSSFILVWLWTNPHASGQVFLRPSCPSTSAVKCFMKKELCGQISLRNATYSSPRFLIIVQHNVKSLVDLSLVQNFLKLFDQINSDLNNLSE